MLFAFILNLVRASLNYGNVTDRSTNRIAPRSVHVHASATVGGCHPQPNKNVRDSGCSDVSMMPMLLPHWPHCFSCSGSSSGGSGDGFGSICDARPLGHYAREPRLAGGHGYVALAAPVVDANASQCPLIFHHSSLSQCKVVNCERT